jgi:hypothetical protein
MKSAKKSLRTEALVTIIVAGFLCVLYTPALAQKDTTSMEHIRGQSGIDPILIHSKMQYNLYVLDTKGPSAKLTFAPGISFGVKGWGVGVRGSAVTDFSGIAGEGFHSSFGDIHLSLQKKVLKVGIHSVAFAGDVGIPTGKAGFGSQYFSMSPMVTYTCTIRPSLILAIQPQYTFHFLKDPMYPDLKTLSFRTLIAKFTNSGHAYGLELKPNLNLEAKDFTLFFTPFLSLNITSGFNMLLLCDIPTNQSAVKKGPTFQFGINRNF